MDARIIEQPSFRLIGHAARVPLIHEGVNPHIQAHIASLPAAEHARLAQLSNTEPGGLPQVSAEVDPDYAQDSELTYLHGVAVAAGTAVEADLDAIDVSAGMWAVFGTTGEHRKQLQDGWAATATEWLPTTSAPRRASCGSPSNGADAPRHQGGVLCTLGGVGSVLGALIRGPDSAQSGCCHHTRTGGSDVEHQHNCPLSRASRFGVDR